MLIPIIDPPSIFGRAYAVVNKTESEIVLSMISQIMHVLCVLQHLVEEDVIVLVAYHLSWLP